MKTEERIFQAIVNGQTRIEIDGRTIELPTPQRTGTISQRRAYARLTAKHIVKEMGKRFPRYCDVTGEGMHEGWCVADGAMYIKNEKDAIAHAQEEGYEDLDDAFYEDYMYFTDWSEIPEDEWDEKPENY